MAIVIFHYKGNQTKIKCLEEEKMKDICNKFISEVNINLNNAYLLYKGTIINMELKYNEIINKVDKDSNIMNVFVYNKESNIICPNCGENIYIDICDIITFFYY